MTRVAVLGASGRIATHVVEQLGLREDIDLTLVLRNAARLATVPEGARVLEGDVLDRSLLTEALRDQDVVYANLSGDVADQARAIIEVMDEVGTTRLIFVTSIGILDEVPGAFGEWNRQMIGSMLTEYRKARTSSRPPTSTTRCCDRPGSPMTATPSTRSPSGMSPSGEPRFPGAGWRLS